MTNPRAAAARIVDQVLRQGRSLSALLEAPACAPGDRPLVQELSYGTVRCYFRLERIARGLLQKPLKERDGDLRALLLLGLYQLLEMRVPEHAAVSETVAAVTDLQKPWARGLVNAVLRRFLRERAARVAAAQADAEGRWNHPQWLIDSLRAAWPAQWEAILRANNQRPPMTLRVNQSRTSPQEYLRALEDAGIPATASPRLAEAVTLAEPVEVGRLPGFAQGLVSVQDEAAQLAAGLLQLAAGQRVLDVCAAPGGKTAHILETAAVDLVALDIDAQRLARVRDTLARLGQQARLIAGDAARPADWWDGRPFDRILLDAPCSATGVIRRHPDIKLLRQAADIPRLAATQALILDSVWPLLKPGGILLYATCSVLPAENTAQITAFLQRQPDAVCRDWPLAWGRVQPAGAQLLPGDGGGDDGSGGMDGFYYACLYKAESTR